MAAYETSLAQAEHLDLFTCWAAARAGLMMVRLDRCEAAEPLIAQALALGPALGRHEARWAAAELAVARGDDDATERVGAALAATTQGGALVYRPRLLTLSAIVSGPDAP